MKEVINGLRKNQVICPKNIEDIKKYINKKYPDCDSKRSSTILADAIYKIIDRNIQTFNEEERRIIKRRVLRRASAKDKFSLDSYDIFTEYISVYGSKNLDQTLLNWVNQNQSEVVTKEDMLVFLHNLSEYAEVSIEAAIEKVIGDEEYIHNDVKKYIIADSKVDALENNLKEHRSILKATAAKIKDLLFILSKEVAAQFSISIEYITHNTKFAAICAGIILIAVLASGIYEIENKEHNDSSSNAIYQLNDAVYYKENVKATKWEDNLSWELRYMDIDLTALKNWLSNRNSLLANEPYFSAIINAGRRNDVNPLFLFAITGQEQNFVPKSQKNAVKIANNPFNVYGSWVRYNTNINDSAEIAAKTIANLGKNRPTAIDEIQWVNRKYAQDRRWWVGVRRILTKMQNDVYDK